MYVVGEVIGDMCFLAVFEFRVEKLLDFDLVDFFGSFLKIIMEDQIVEWQYEAVDYDFDRIQEYLEQVFCFEVVACKDWLINKVDCCVGGLVAK